MMKKVTSYMLILLANIILLAHAVMPHHHHHQLQFCIEDTHCQHHHNPINTSHEHDGESDSDCILKQLIIFPSNHYKLECKYIDIANINFPHGLNVVDLNNKFQLFVEKAVNEIESPSSKLYYPLLLNTQTGLRAPPTV